MKFPKVYSLEEIANLLNCEFVGDKNFEVFGMNEIHVVEKGDIVFVDHPKYYDKALQSDATIVLINKTWSNGLYCICFHIFGAGTRPV